MRTCSLSNCSHAHVDPHTHILLHTLMLGPTHNHTHSRIHTHTHADNYPTMKKEILNCNVWPMLVTFEITRNLTSPKKLSPIKSKNSIRYRVRYRSNNISTKKRIPFGNHFQFVGRNFASGIIFLASSVSIKL